MQLTQQWLLNKRNEMNISWCGYLYFLTKHMLEMIFTGGKGCMIYRVILPGEGKIYNHYKEKYKVSGFI
ncbi:hypothetical protein FY526_19815 [Clostridioides difficile]|nr:hypothetical protein FY526_19815 [Clostridioides difficile]